MVKYIKLDKTIRTSDTTNKKTNNYKEKNKNVIKQKRTHVVFIKCVKLSFFVKYLNYI